ncbi:CDP-diacylglycerol diphosphatase [Methylobacterium durans]|uniref:CDP-diacylglycerol diphosphatase n=1 Tax=Methylobacterium durans TaxID=2202825 RepID=UPI002AFE51C4|nr:CDP-diacylglycerol diphosphatase [Methylobacterium durans]MEA1834426.1 CDP-diacylglycerol diphosphatase [Methylobacterium durans]
MCRSVVLAILLSTVATPVAAEAGRQVLWVAIQACVLAKRTTGRPFPCLAVDLGTDGRPGTAVLRAPGQPTHTVVVPTSHVVGLEAPELQHERGNAYWRAALAARHHVADALKGSESPGDIALAVNSRGGRSQDQLHIHLDCVRPSVRAALRVYARGIHRTWAAMPIALQGTRFFAMRIEPDELESINPFAAIAQLPGRRPDLAQTSFAAINVSGDDLPASLILLAYRAKDAHAEKLLDHTCSGAGKPAAAIP